MTAPTKTVAGGGGYGARRTTDDNGVISNDAGTSSSSVPANRDMEAARRNSLRSTPGAFHIDGPSMPAGDGAGDDDDNSAVAEVRAALAAEEAEGRAVRVGGIGTVPDEAMPEGSDNSSAARRENGVLDVAMTVVSEITTPPSVAQVHPMPNTRNNGEVSNDAMLGTSPPTNRRPSMETSGAVITQAYTVEEGATSYATVVDTVMGVDRRRFLQMVGCGLIALLVIVLAVAIPLSQRRSSAGTTNQDTTKGISCGSLCPNGEAVPDPEQLVFGVSCQDWEETAQRPDDEDSPGSKWLLARSISSMKSLNSADASSSVYLYDCDALRPIAYGCGCPDPTTSTSAVTPQQGKAGCGNLCSDGSDLPDPDLEVSDMWKATNTCREWEILSLFESDAEECPMYNAIGKRCGCSNVPHPDACGNLCPNDEEYLYRQKDFPIWGTTCEQWDTFSNFLPHWYRNPNNETCDEYYREVAYGCFCPGARRPPLATQCGTLCQELRTCDTLCQDGSPPPNLSAFVRQGTCQGWEMQSRVEQEDYTCPWYKMIGAQCGCESNQPPANSWADKCGAFCGDSNIPNPEQVVNGKTCEDWRYMASHLAEDYEYLSPWGTLRPFASCEQIHQIEYGCGCDNSAPPDESCGKLCGNDVDLPDPLLIKGGRPCGDWELRSVFDTNVNNCQIYDVVRDNCGCETTNKYQRDCFKYEYLEDKTWYFGSMGINQYGISFGDAGTFVQIHNTDNLGATNIGGYETIDEGGTAYFSGGHPCLIHGPRTGSVSIIENSEVAEPTIVSVAEAATCSYHAVMHVPTFCETQENA